MLGLPILSGFGVDGAEVAQLRCQPHECGVGSSCRYFYIDPNNQESAFEDGVHPSRLVKHYRHAPFDHRLLDLSFN